MNGQQSVVLKEKTRGRLLSTQLCSWPGAELRGAWPSQGIALGSIHQGLELCPTHFHLLSSLNTSGGLRAPPSRTWATPLQTPDPTIGIFALLLVTHHHLGELPQTLMPFTSPEPLLTPSTTPCYKYPSQPLLVH